MKTKELKIQAPEGYEIDKEKSTLDCIKFRPIKKSITYEDVCNKLFKNSYFFTNEHGGINSYAGLSNRSDENNALTSKQLERLLALNQLLNIAEYYNILHPKCINHITIEYDGVNNIYYPSGVSIRYQRGIQAIFNNWEDAKAVIDNPNFREILNTIYKD